MRVHVQNLNISAPFHTMMQEWPPSLTNSQLPGLPARHPGAAVYRTSDMWERYFKKKKRKKSEIPETHVQNRTHTQSCSCAVHIVGLRGMENRPHFLQTWMPSRLQQGCGNQHQKQPEPMLRRERAHYCVAFFELLRVNHVHNCVRACLSLCILLMPVHTHLSLLLAASEPTHTHVIQWERDHALLLVYVKRRNDMNHSLHTSLTQFQIRKSQKAVQISIRQASDRVFVEGCRTRGT
mmetsp:Transcript_106857/g.180381  ORF Transcript_106857/g.180381 Transcript_106857/m.180381 type:complete len:237 (+) Transcript_106857:1124-1834(+)